MPSHFNSAFRVHTFLAQAARQRSDIRTENAWANVFDIRYQESIKQSLEVAQKVRKLYAELELAHQQMRASTFTASKYEPVFESAYKSLNVAGMYQQWKDFQQHLTENTLNMLSFFSEVLEHEEDPIDSVELTRLAEQLEELRQEILASTLPEDAKSYMLRQIEILQGAVTDYPITGKKVFTQAFVQATTTYVLNLQTVRSNEADEEFRTSWDKIKDAWSFIRERTEDVQALLALYGGATAAGQFAGFLTGP